MIYVHGWYEGEWKDNKRDGVGSWFEFDQEEKKVLKTKRR